MMGCAHSSRYTFKIKENRKAILTKFRHFDSTVRDDIQGHHGNSNMPSCKDAWLNENDNVPNARDGWTANQKAVPSDRPSQLHGNYTDQASGCCYGDTQIRAWHSEQTMGANVRSSGQTQPANTSNGRCHASSSHPDVEMVSDDMCDTRRADCVDLEINDDMTCRHALDGGVDPAVYKHEACDTQKHQISQHLRADQSDKYQCETMDSCHVICHETLDTALPCHDTKEFTLPCNVILNSLRPCHVDSVESQPPPCNADALVPETKTDQNNTSDIQISSHRNTHLSNRCQCTPHGCQCLCIYTSHNNADTDPCHYVTSDSQDQHTSTSHVETQDCGCLTANTSVDNDGPHCIIDIQADEAGVDQHGYHRGWDDGYQHGYQLAWSQAYEQGYYQGWTEGYHHGYPLGWEAGLQQRSAETVSHESGDWREN